ncbi:MAG TPA: PD-(D/E)XK motif protein [Methylibium sp.]|uniref:PD-(D/E)XK motif protein n=1 Tax=Methylibium sp. TaxID=2067992 RepID=UPI002DBD3BBB|nr:PD-(D/E)XK motif protein [Methylibium sp.]HEU4460856.1 PD-(D/E)XK motif protein [Methylibium sp.]
MARPIDDIELAWRSLRDSLDASGWRSISVAVIGSCALRAGLSYPGKNEALLASFSSSAVPATEKLPAGQGFDVARVEQGGDGLTWLALTRSANGSLELFAAMVVDVVHSMRIEPGADDKRLARVFLGRIRAWQEFMRKGAQPLSPESEIGLVGELTLLRAIVEAGVFMSAAIESWVGPLDGVQDFELGTGSLEVKTTLSAAGFPAKIGSLEQLDDSARQPLFLAGARMRQMESGQNLSALVAEIRYAARGDAEAMRLLNERLIAAGYLDAHADLYVRRFALVDARFVEVKDGFPRLTQGSVPLGVTRATYEIDLDKFAGTDVPAVDALKRLGAV